MSFSCSLFTRSHSFRASVRFSSSFLPRHFVELFKVIGTGKWPNILILCIFETLFWTFLDKRKTYTKRGGNNFNFLKCISKTRTCNLFKASTTIESLETFPKTGTRSIAIICLKFFYELKNLSHPAGLFFILKLLNKLTICHFSCDEKLRKNLAWYLGI